MTYHQWIIILIRISAIIAYRLRTSEFEDALSEGAMAAASVMNDADSTLSTYAIMADYSISPSSISQFIGNLGDNLGFGMIHIPNIRNDKDGQELSSVRDSLLQLRRSSKSLNILLIGDDVMILASALQLVLNQGFLVWPRKLLIITRLQPPQLQPMQQDLSVANAMVLFVDRATSSKRIYLYVPFSQRLINIASWTKDNKFSYKTDLRMFPNKFEKLADGGKIMVTGEEYPPHLKLDFIPNQITGDIETKYSGPVITLLDLLATTLNFTYGLTRPPDGSWGYLLPNGSWTGMVGQAARKEVQISLGPLAITYARTLIVDYTSPLFVDYVRISARRGETEVDTWGFAMPLTPLVWASTFVSFLIVLILAKILPFHMTSTNLKAEKESISNYLRILLQQDLIKSNIQGWTEKILIGGWMITVLVLIESYSCNLMSLLAVRYVSQPYQTIKDVVDDKRITMLWEGNTAYIQHFMSATSGIFYELAETRKDDRIGYLSSLEYDNAMKTKVMQGDHVLMIEDLALKMLLAKQFSETGACKFYLSKEMFLHFPFAMILQQHSQFAPAINKRVKAVTESGLYDHWVSNAVPNSTSCVNAPTKIAIQSTLSIHNLWGIFMIPICGYIIGFVSLLIEEGIKNFCPTDANQ